MSLDTTAQLPCEPRLHFGNNDVVEGTRAILHLLKAKGRADTIESFAAQENRDPYAMTVTINETYGGELVQREVGLKELRDKEAPLWSHHHACSHCQANVLGQPYGCFVTVHYPIPTTSEGWLIGRLEEPGSGGWSSCLLFLADFGIDGSTSKDMRRRGFFESRQALSRRRKLGFFKSESVTTDQLFDILLKGGEAQLEPEVCGIVLFWLGCLAVDGKIPGRVEDDPRIETFQELLSLPEQRSQRTKLTLDPTGPDREAGELLAIMDLLYRCWILDVPFYHWG